MEREFENLLAIGDKLTNYVATLDEYSGNAYESISDIVLRQFLTEFV